MTPAPAAPTFLGDGGEAGALIRAIDWSASPLGPLAGWPQSLRTAVSMCIGSRFPIALYWGPRFVMLYNDDLVPMVGANKHPAAMGRPAFEVLPEIREIIEPLLLRVIRTGEATLAEDLMLPLLRHAAQEESYFTFSYSPIHDESGGVGGVFCAVVETTDKVIEGRRLRLLNALASASQAGTPAEACARAATQLAGAPDDVPFAALYLLDETAAVATLAGAVHVAPGSAFAPASIALGPGAVWPFSATGGQAARSVELAEGPGGARGAVILPIERATGGRPLGFLVAGLSPLLRSAASYERFHNLLAASISQSVSNAAAYAAERQRAEALAALDRAKTTFFSNISHELRTPLTLMLAPIQDLAAAPAGAPIDAVAVDLLQRNAQRLLKLVNTLLEFSRIEAGRVEARYEPVDLAALTAELASGFRAAIDRAGLALVVDCPPLPAPVYVDRDMWEKIVLNLLSNAFKFTFAGAITVRLRAEADAAVLEVADTGTGIAEAELPRLFERFHRIAGARSRSHEGSGIGLALIQELVRLHHGDLAVTSQLGAGSVFAVRIPRGSAHLPADRITAPAPVRATLASEPYVREALQWTAPVTSPATSLASIMLPARPATASPRERIVVADDNADMRDYLGRLLGERWDVELAGDGESALAAIRSARPALVLTDAMMSGLDGFGLIEALRGDPATRALPIILLSARAGDDEAARGLGAGANDYIAKPFSARDLLVRVASALAVARAADEMRAREQIQRGNLYRHFMQAPFPVCVFQGPDHVIELANPAILGAWGKTAEVVGLPLLAAIPALRDQPFVGYLDGVYRTGVAYEGRAELARVPTGPAGALEDFYFNFVYAPLRDQAGAIEGVLVSAFDVTDQVRARNERARLLEDERRARADAEAARARIDALFMITPAPICMLEGPEHVFTLLNQPYLDLIRRDDLLGKTFASQYPERVMTLARLDQVYATGETLRGAGVPFRAQADQAEANLYDVIYQPFRDATGQVAGILLVAFDVTEVTRARQASEHARRDAEAAAQAQRAMVEFQERFVAILGHDLRNPLAAVDMAAGLLRQQAGQAGNPAVHRIVGRIQSSSQRMSRMVEQILDLSRSRVGGGLAIQPAPLDLCAMLTSVVDELRMANPTAELVLRCAPALGQWDRDRLEQVFSNLISNAIHHGLAGAPITIDVQPGGARVRVTVHNQGPPISEPIRANLFSPFRRGDRDSRANKTAGLGLGLYISRELVVGHGGDIEVQSSAEHGTTFIVTLPLA